MRTALLLLTLFLSSCSLFEDDNDPGVFLEVNQRVYTSQESAVISLVNLTDKTLDYNLCGALLERRVEGRWEFADPRNSVCTAIAYTLKSGRLAKTERSLANVEPGTYRFTYEMTEGDGSNEKRFRKIEQLLIFTSSFEVQ